MVNLLLPPPLASGIRNTLFVISSPSSSTRGRSSSSSARPLGGSGRQRLRLRLSCGSRLCLAKARGRLPDRRLRHRVVVVGALRRGVHNCLPQPVASCWRGCSCSGLLTPRALSLSLSLSPRVACSGMLRCPPTGRRKDKSARQEHGRGEKGWQIRARMRAIGSRTVSQRPMQCVAKPSAGSGAGGTGAFSLTAAAKHPVAAAIARTD